MTDANSSDERPASLPVPDPATAIDLAPAPPAAKRRPPVAIIMLAAALAVVVGVLVWIILELRSALDLIDEQSDQISDLNEMIDTRQEFGAAMDGLMATAAQLDGAPMAELVPFDDYQIAADAAWLHRRSPSAVSDYVEIVSAYQASLEVSLAHADAQRADNATGTRSERIVDELGGGFATVSYDNADKLCETDVIGCVTGDDPYVIHLDRNDLSHPAVDAWAERLVTLHEFAHVLQFTNPEATDAAADSFSGDWEYMADCYALNEMNEWTLDHRVWVSASQYWDTSYGYGKVCGQSQRDVIDSWLSELGVHYRGISQATT